MKRMRAFKLGIRIAIVFTIVVFVVSLYNLFAFLGSVISDETFSLDLVKNESTGDWTFSLDGILRNNGFLGVGLSFELAVFDLDDRVIASDSTSLNIGAGGSQRFSLSLFIPAGFVQGEELQGDEGYMRMRMSVRTLGGLVGLTNIMKIGGGGD